MISSYHRASSEDDSSECSSDGGTAEHHKPETNTDTSTTGGRNVEKEEEETQDFIMKEGEGEAVLQPSESKSNTNTNTNTNTNIASYGNYVTNTTPAQPNPINMAVPNMTMMPPPHMNMNMNMNMNINMNSMNMNSMNMNSMNMNMAPMGLAAHHLHPSHHVHHHHAHHHPHHHPSMAMGINMNLLNASTHTSIAPYPPPPPDSTPSSSATPTLANNDTANHNSTAATPTNRNQTNNNNASSIPVSASNVTLAMVVAQQQQQQHSHGAHSRSIPQPSSHPSPYLIPSAPQSSSSSSHAFSILSHDHHSPNVNKHIHHDNTNHTTNNNNNNNNNNTTTQDPYCDDDSPCHPNTLCTILSQRTGQTNSTDPTSWTVRDPIYSLLSTRHARLPKHNDQQIHSHSHKLKLKLKQPKSKTQTKGLGLGLGGLLNSNNFDVMEAIATVKSDANKATIVRKTFDASACSVIRAILRTRHSHSNSNSNSITTITDTSTTPTTTTALTNLPPFLRILNSLSTAKDQSITTALRKRKIHLDRNNPNAHKKSRILDTKTSTSPSKDSSGNTAPSQSNSINNSTTTTSNNNNNNNTSTVLQSSQSNPSQTTTTTTASTNIDSRATVSRAILCAAASLTFKHLTPPSSSSHTNNKDGFHVINVLDVPQNVRATHTNTTTSTTPKQKEDNLKQQQQPRPVINMGAVVMSAEIFANRSMEQARGAARRGDRRRRWRMDCTRRDLMQKEQSFHSRRDTRLGGGGLGSFGSSSRSNSSSVGALVQWLDLKNPFCFNAKEGRHLIDNDDEDEEDEEEDSGSSTEEEEDDDDDDDDDDDGIDNDCGRKFMESVGDMNHMDHDKEDDDDNDDDSGLELLHSKQQQRIRYVPHTRNEEWNERCLPRLLDIMHDGPGHVILHDLQWKSRADRIVQVLHGLALSDPTCTDDEGDHPLAEVSSSSTAQIKKEEKGASRRRKRELNYGPHLIVTTAADIDKFERLFAPLQYSCSDANINLVSSDDDDGDEDDATNHANNKFQHSSSSKNNFHLRALRYTGTVAQRRRTRIRYFTPTSLSGLKDTPFHVVLVTYQVFLTDYIHLCQIPFQAVVLDDGMSWLGTSHFDPNGQLGKVWDMGVWSKSDNHAGLAGVGHDTWDFSTDVASDGILPKNRASYAFGRRSGSKEEKEQDDKKKKFGAAGGPLIGLSARHKILLASSMHSKYRDVVYAAPVPALLSFLMPQFSDVVKEEWDRSRIHTCVESMDHVRKLLCRGIVVYTGAGNDLRDLQMGDPPSPLQDMFTLALESMLGTLDVTQFKRRDRDSAMDGDRSDSDDEDSTMVPEMHGSRMSSYPYHHYSHANHSYGTKTGIPREVSTDEMVSDGKIVQSRRFAASWLRANSPIRYELGITSLDPILNAMKIRASCGHVCEEVVTASSITSSGAGGAVTGPAGYRAAVRCGRTFGSEQGLRQHMAALHAPPGTWLCRSCGSDCGTSQARTHHERSCGTNASCTPGGGKENTSGGGIPTVGQGIGSAAINKQGAVPLGQGTEDKDKDGCFRVPGYRGVWVNPTGKHFVKVNGTPLTKVANDEKAKESSSGGTIIVFDNADEAAKMYDEVLKKRGEDKGAEKNFKADGSRIVYEDAAASTAAGRGLEMLGGGASSVVPALSVINIKDLPKGVVPLLRDPRQTSRTGGNSKRYVYAYRGVCRQARKGHDRWQSQISFGGTNHYLGTFDSEWDAAAIYAWAHLILYGDEATKKAQKEGEEAVAAWEQEKKDIAEGKIVAPPPKEKKKKAAPKSKQGAASKAKTQKKKDVTRKKGKSEEINKGTKPDSAEPSDKLMKDDIFQAQSASNTIPKISDSVSCFDNLPVDDNNLIWASAERILATRDQRGQSECSISAFKNVFNNTVCIPVDDSASQLPSGCAMLVGLAASDFGWNIESFYESAKDLLNEESRESLVTLQSEYGSDGYNLLFRSVMQGAPCFIGRAGKNLEKASAAIGLHGAELGGTIADIDCNVGGIDGSCSEIAACILFSTSSNSLQFSACNEDDIVTLNGQQIIPSMGNFVIQNKAICSVGPRVFMLILPTPSN